jgi:hypothetical protein
LLAENCFCLWFSASKFASASVHNF